MSLIKTHEEALRVQKSLQEINDGLDTKNRVSGALDFILANYIASVDRIDKNASSARRKHKEILARCKQAELEDESLCLSCIQDELAQDQLAQDALAQKDPAEARRYLEECVSLKPALDDFYYVEAQKQIVSLKARKQ